MRAQLLAKPLVKLPAKKQSNSIRRLALIAALFMSVEQSFAGGGSVSFDVSLFPGSPFTAHAETVVGSASKAKDGTYIAKNIVVKINDLTSGIDLRDDHMKKNYFESATYPEAKVIAAKGRDGKFAANLVVHGIKQKVVGTYEVSGSQLTAKFKAKMSDFKIKKASYMGVGVGDEIDVVVTIPVK